MTGKLPVQKALGLDALTCVAAGLLMALGANALASVTGLPVDLLRFAGIALLPVAALFGWLARARHVPLALVWIAILGNLAWVLASAVVIALYDPTPFGCVFVLVQAAAVLLLTFAEWRGLNAMRTTAA